MNDAQARQEELRAIYGDFSLLMREGGRIRTEVRDRMAYVFITGQFPSHLRKVYTAMIADMTRPFRKPSGLDGRVGTLRLHEAVVADLGLEQHSMVKEVRAQIARGYLIEPSRGFGTRRPYTKIFMFGLSGDRRINPISVRIDGAVKQGWL